MIHRPIYEPKGRAKEYGDLALNIYRGCNHGCTYCFAPGILRMSREEFLKVEPREDIIGSVSRQIHREGITGKLIHLCFSCDPYPTDIDTTPTRETIKLLKEAGNNVQILTKGGLRAIRDFDLLTPDDWFGITYTGGLNGVGVKNDYEPNAEPDSERFISLKIAQHMGIKTWVSFEPVFDPDAIYQSIKYDNFIDLYRIGKLNHMKYIPEGFKPFNWASFGAKCVQLCKEYGRNYYIKDDLLEEMFRNESPERWERESYKGGGTNG